MRHDNIADTLNALLACDPDVCTSDELDAIMPLANQLLGYAQHVHVRIHRRRDELHRHGQSPSGANAAVEHGKSGKEAQNIKGRDRVCSEFPQLEDALATGAATADHLDVLNRLTKNLTDSERCDLQSVAADIVESARSDFVSVFENKTKEIIATIKTTNRPADEAADLDRQRRESSMKRWTDEASGLKCTLIKLDPLRDAEFHTAVDAQLAQLRQDEANRELPFAQLQVQAVVNAMSAKAAAQRIPEVVIHVDARSACHGRHADTLCETVDGDPIPVSTAQRLCCEATIDAVFLDERGVAQRLHTEARTANRAQRRALAAMYSTCAHPHCTVRFSDCRIHHVRWWSKGGPTAMPNLVPLCETHHHLVHEGGWSIEIEASTRRLTWIQPDGEIWKTDDGPNRKPTGTTPCDRPPPKPPDRSSPDRSSPDRSSPDHAPAEWRQPTLC